MKNSSLLLLMLLSITSPALMAQAAAQEAEPKTGTRTDPVKLPGADVVGNRELPVGLDIVPWRPADTGEVKEGPTQLLDAPLKPIDPEVFRRELSIYQSSQQP
jgi:hypothetical protein